MERATLHANSVSVEFANVRLSRNFDRFTRLLLK